MKHLVFDWIHFYWNPLLSFIPNVINNQWFRCTFQDIQSVSNNRVLFYQLPLGSAGFNIEYVSLLVISLIKCLFISILTRWQNVSMDPCFLLFLQLTTQFSDSPELPVCQLIEYNLCLTRVPCCLQWSVNVQLHIRFITLAVTTVKWHLNIDISSTAETHHRILHPFWWLAPTEVCSCPTTSRWATTTQDHTGCRPCQLMEPRLQMSTWLVVVVHEKMNNKKKGQRTINGQ